MLLRVEDLRQRDDTIETPNSEHGGICRDLRFVSGGTQSGARTRSIARPHFIEHRPQLQVGVAMHAASAQGYEPRPHLYLEIAPPCLQNPPLQPQRGQGPITY